MKRALTLVATVLIVSLISLAHPPVATAQLRLLRARPSQCAVGQCFDTRQRRCTGQPCGPGAPCGAHQLCDARTRLCPCELGGAAQIPTAQCTDAACGGRCIVSVPCTSPPCPAAVPVRLGQCELVPATGTCECVPLPTPTPRPTRTPACAGAAACQGSCVICPPCTGTICPEVACIEGTCQAESVGNGCTCVPSVPATPTPKFTPTPACESVPCSGSCVICPPCPPGVICNGPPCVVGTCAVTSGGCACVPPASPTPRPTATPACQSGPCEGSCVIGFPCPPGKICNGPISLVGTCEMTSSGCACVPPPTLTPRPTPTPACQSVPCEGFCVVCPACPPGMICPEPPCVLGTCEVTSAGCACVPPASPTPRPTPTPVCAGVPCDGPCVMCFPCPPNTVCPDLCVVGTCGMTANCCACMPPPTPTPRSTPTPACADAACSGSCAICRPCPPGMICPDTPCLHGVCQVDSSSGSCQCVPNVPPPPPPCVGWCLPHGHTCCECPNQAPACRDLTWVEVEPVCPPGCTTVMDAECEAPCGPGPQGGPATCVSLTPCTTDQDCDDGNACTVDHCTIDGCTHQCACVVP